MPTEPLVNVLGTECPVSIEVVLNELIHEQIRDRDTLLVNKVLELVDKSVSDIFNHLLGFVQYTFLADLVVKGLDGPVK